MNTSIGFLYNDFKQSGDIDDMIETLVIYLKHLEERIEKLENKGIINIGH